MTNSLENKIQSFFPAHSELQKKVSQGLKDFRERFDQWKAEQAVWQVEGKSKACASDKE